MHVKVRKEPSSAVHEGWRVLKDGGEFTSITYCYGDTSLLEKLKLVRWVLRYGKPRYWSNFTSDTIEGYFLKAGFLTYENILIWKNPAVLFLRSRKPDTSTKVQGSR